jgi:cytidylate kinase
VEYYDKEILNAIVEALPEDKAAIERLDHHVKLAWHDVLHEIVTGRSRLDQYRHHLIQVILAIGRKSGVVVGRGANFILAKHKVFRVNIIGSADVCAQRLLKQESVGLDTPLSLDEAKRRVLQAHEERAGFIKQLFGQDINALGAHDLVLNTDHIPVERAPDVIVYAMEQAGFAVAQAMDRSKLADVA